MKSLRWLITVELVGKMHEKRVPCSKNCGTVTHLGCASSTSLSKPDSIMLIA
jgi:hypothetical protein